MTMHELLRSVAEAKWFACIEPISSLLDSAEQWDWLPTSRDQEDPIHGQSMKLKAAEIVGDNERHKLEMAAAQAVFKSMRGLPESLKALRDGPHDYTVAAKAGAVYAVRMASREIIAGSSGFWCQVVREFAKGQWPCGVDGEKQLVIL